MKIAIHNKKIYVLSLLSFCFFHMNGQTQQNESIKLSDILIQDRLIIIPAYYNELSVRLGLSNINNIDSFSFRLWSSSMMGASLITFTKQNKVWNSHKYRYNSDTSIKEEILTPKISVSDFINELQFIDLESLISQYQISNFKNRVDDGTLYTLEILKENYYKVVQYHSPDAYDDKDNKKFSALLKIIEEYFHTKSEK